MAEVRRYCKQCARSTVHVYLTEGISQQCQDCGLDTIRYDIRRRPWAGDARKGN